MKKKEKKFFICCNNISWKHGCVVCELQCFSTVGQLAAGLLYKALSSIFHYAVNRSQSEVAPWGALQ